MRLLPRRGPKIDDLKQAGDVEALRAVLEHPDPSASGDGPVWSLGAPARAEAAAALATFEGTVVEDGLAHALADPDPRVRATALERISQRTSPVAVAPLIGAVITWPYPEEYDALEKALGTLVGWAPQGLAETYVHALLEVERLELDERHQDALGALTGADPAGEAAAGNVTDYLVAQLEEPASTARVARIQQLLAWLGDSAFDSVLRRLDSGAAGPAVIGAAGALRDSRAVDPLVALTAASNPAVRAAAATALGTLNDTRAVQALTAATQDPHHTVRDRASDALNGMGVAAVIVGVASVIGDAVREQLEAGPAPRAEGAEKLSPGSENRLPAAGEEPPLPPTWAQEALTRLLRRMGG